MLTGQEVIVQGHSTAKRFNRSSISSRQSLYESCFAEPKGRWTLNTTSHGGSSFASRRKASRPCLLTAFLKKACLTSFLGTTTPKRDKFCFSSNRKCKMKGESSSPRTTRRDENTPENSCRVCNRLSGPKPNEIEVKPQDYGGP